MSEAKFSEWRPIETLPDDGRWSLVLDAKSGAYDIARPIGPGAMKADPAVIESAFHRCITSRIPTHWTPLPEPPEDAAR